VFDLSLNSQYGFVLKMCRIPKRIGYNFKNRGRFLTHKQDLPGGFCGKHVALYHLDLLRFLDKEPRIYGLDTSFSFGYEEQKKAFADIDKDSLKVAVFPGSGDSWGGSAYFKRWPRDNFLNLCLEIREKLKAEVILLGSGSEKALCNDIAGSIPDRCFNFCAALDLEELCSLLLGCNLVITNDGGPFHLGQALGIPTVGFFGPVDENVYGCFPGNEKCHVFKSDIGCRPCYYNFKFSGCHIDRRCLKDIGVGEVFDKIENLLSK
ncbi:MAG: hypothetical protein GF375_02770, partial [Candidatus Omnitrophica bacterium]|nr:hypothetical protein [Candidatus Omnitrophota bacterium]MBD3269019.1 hypothetical protein [Candidatus Omnitrophota bacterium]